MKCQAFINRQCTSCDYLGHEFDYSKKAKTSELFKLFPNLKEEKFLGFIQNESAKGSRKKVKLAVRQNEQEEFEFGIYNGQQLFIKLEDCPLHDPIINQWLKKFKAMLPAYQIRAYDLKSQKGEFKNIIINLSNKNELMVRLVFRSKESLDRIKKMAAQMDPIVKVFSFNIQAEHKAVLEGEEEIVLSKDNHLQYDFEGIDVHLGVKSFFQVNTEMALKLYQDLADFLKNKNIDTMLDLYCGVGAFSFLASKNVKKILGVEISKSAIESARLTKAKANLANLDFLALDVESFLPNQKENFQVILCNPPRRGLGSKLTNELVEMRPEYLVYSSCNAQTLKHDSEKILEKYEIVSAKIFDMFPYSKHFETLMIFKRI